MKLLNRKGSRLDHRERERGIGLLKVLQVPPWLLYLFDIDIIIIIMLPFSFLTGMLDCT